MSEDCTRYECESPQLYTYDVTHAWVLLWSYPEDFDLGDIPLLTPEGDLILL